MSRHTVIFWNLARLFGSGGSPIEHALSLGDEDSRATEPEVTHKLQVIAATIDHIAARNGPPALVGFTEIESASLAKHIAELVTSTKLAVIDEAAKDETGFALDGLNISLLFDPEVFDGEPRARSHVLDSTFDARDVLEVDLRTSKAQSPVSVILNHWASRLSAEGKPRRIAAAHYLARLIERKTRFTLREMWDGENAKMDIPNNDTLIRRARTPVLVMGDFNDEVFDESLAVLHATPHADEVIDDLNVRGRSDRDRFSSYFGSGLRLLNPFWAFAGRGGSYYRSPRWRTYDQMLFSRGLVEEDSDNPFRYVPGSASIQALEEVIMPDGTSYRLTNRGGKPIKYEPENDRGCSDHFPISATLEL